MISFEFLPALGHAVVNSFWQMAILWVLYQAWQLIFSKSSAAVRSQVAGILLITGFVWFTISLFSWAPVSANQLASEWSWLQGPASWNVWMQQLFPYAASLYLILLIIPIINFVRNVQYVRAIRSQGLQKADAGWRLFVQKIAGRMGIRRSVAVWLSDRVQTPVTIGFLRPIILLPIAAINQLQPDQVEAILLHELAHIRRYDYLLNLLVRIIQTLLYFNPFVRAFVRIIDTEREKSCDEMVMQFQYNAHHYATALLVLEKSSSPSLAMAAAGTRHGQQLMGRVENILGIRRQAKRSLLRLSALLLALAFLTGVHFLLDWKSEERKLAFQDMTAFMDSPFIMSAETSNERASSIATNETVNENGDPHVSNTLTTAPAPESEAAPIAAEAPLTVLGVDPASWYEFVTSRENVLTEAEKQDVQKAIQASKRVLEEIQWKTMEKDIADAMTKAEKEQVREELKLKAEEANWKKLEEKLKQAYGNINWPALNAELESAVAEIRLDSLQDVVLNAVSGLAQLSKEMESIKAESIPDTDITREAIEQKRMAFERKLDSIRSASRVRKIIKL